MGLRPFLIALWFVVSPAVGVAQAWPEAKAPAIPQADGYVEIPGAAVPPDPNVTYRAIFDGVQKAAKPDALLPSINAAGGVLNDLAVGKVPSSGVQMAIIFHGPAVDGLLNNAAYRSKYGLDNPNLAALTALKSHGVVLLVCGQHLAAEKLDPKSLSPDVTVASDAYLVLISYQNRGYAVMAF